MALERIFRNLNWVNYGISIFGNCPSNLRFVDDVVLLSNKQNEQQKMMNGLVGASKEASFELNICVKKNGGGG